MWKLKGKQMPVACIYKKICSEMKCTSEAISRYVAICNIVMRLNSSEELLDIYLYFAVGINSTVWKLTWNVLMSKCEEISNITAQLAMFYSHMEDKVLQECCLSTYTALFLKLLQKDIFSLNHFFLHLGYYIFFCLFIGKVPIGACFCKVWRSNL